jgi:hypothetical protein
MDAAPGGKPGTYQGLVEIVIGETGRVVQVAIRKSIHPSFDAEIIASTDTGAFSRPPRTGNPSSSGARTKSSATPASPQSHRHDLTNAASHSS